MEYVCMQVKLTSILCLWSWDRSLMLLNLIKNMSCGIFFSFVPFSVSANVVVVFFWYVVVLLLSIHLNGFGAWSQMHLSAVWEGCLFGIYHESWESFNTYPRTNYLLHADKHFSKLIEVWMQVPFNFSHSTKTAPI